MRTLQYAKDFIDWKKAVKEEHPDKFFWHDEGMTVITPSGEKGVITEYTYFPSNDTFYICVRIRAKYVPFSDPNVLEVVEAEEFETMKVSDR